MSNGRKLVPEIFVSSGAFESRALSEVLSAADEQSIANIELSSGIESDPANLDLVGANAGKFNFLFHNYFPAPAKPFVLNLAADDLDILEASLAHCKQALELTAEYQAPFYSVHAGFLSQPRVQELGRQIKSQSPISRKTGLNNFYQSVNELIEYAKNLGVKLLIENNVVAPFNLLDGGDHIMLLASPNEIVEFARKFDPRYFGILLDVGHLNVSANTLGFVREAAVEEISEFVCALHLSDNDGTVDSNQCFDEKAWFLPVIDSCSVTHIVIEAYNLSQEAIGLCIQHVKKQIHSC